MYKNNNKKASGQVWPQNGPKTHSRACFCNSFGRPSELDFQGLVGIGWDWLVLVGCILKLESVRVQCFNAISSRGNLEHHGGQTLNSGTPAKGSAGVR